jgi:hypothetical protein
MEQQAPGGTAAAWWCRHCDQLVTVTACGLAVHAGSGAELCADGQHVAAPTVSNPAMRKAAAAIAAEHPGWVVAWYLTHFGARPLDFPAALPLEAATEDEMRRRLGARRRPAAGALP